MAEEYDWKEQTVPLQKINLKGNTQPRVSMDRKVVDDYQEDMEEGASFPNPKLFFDGKDYWPGDGFHRICAATQVGVASMKADVVPGTRDDAQYYAAGANWDHGLRRKPEDKRKAVLTLLTNKERAKQSNRKIADHCHVSGMFVGTLRKELEAGGGKKQTKRKAASGKTMETKDIGRKSKKPPKEDPVEEEETSEEPAPATPAERASAKREVRDEMVEFFKSQIQFGKNNEAQRASCFRTFRILSELLALPEGMKIPGIGSAISEMRSLLSSIWKLPWAERISAVDKTAATRVCTSLFEWIDTGTPLKLDAPKEPKAAKEAYQPSKDALNALTWWKKNIGLPQKKQTDEYYAKAFDALHTIDKLSWSDIKEILVGYTVCWQPEGYEVSSPVALRNKTTKGDVRKWESIWKAYKKHPKYKPLSAAPVCPVDGCGANLKRQEAQKGGRLYLAWICVKHPVESAPVGEKFVPRILVKK